MMCTRRSVAESDLYGRDFAEEENVLLTREDLEDLFGRDFVEELEAREPFGLGFVSLVAVSFSLLILLLKECFLFQ